jgi:transcriptional regulator with XRE-family HTH domain
VLLSHLNAKKSCKKGQPRAVSAPADERHQGNPMADNEPTDEDYGRKVGECLRAIRRHKKLTLQEVEAASCKEFKASVLGAYERGERTISVPRLQRLARFYNVPVSHLLPDEEPSFTTPSHPKLDLAHLTDRIQEVLREVGAHDLVVIVASSSDQYR